LKAKESIEQLSVADGRFNVRFGTEGEYHLGPVRIVDGKLFFHLKEDVQKTWEKDMTGYIQKADRNWEKIATRTPEELSRP
jgi:hypothetical protein